MVKELQTLHNLRKLFVQDLQNRVKKVRRCWWWFVVVLTVVVIVVVVVVVIAVVRMG